MAVLILALTLRFWKLGQTFCSSDSVQLATFITYMKGYAWMPGLPYGVMNALIVKIYVTLQLLAGTTLDEFVWYTPIALFGSLQCLITYFFLRKIELSSISALVGALISATIPIHIGLSRYMWGNDVFGNFFLHFALLGLISYFRSPSKKGGVLAGLAISMYLTSHVLIVPFFMLSAICLLLYTNQENRTSRLEALRDTLHRCVTNRLWLFPVLSIPLFVQALAHTYSEPKVPFVNILRNLQELLRGEGLFYALLIMLSVAWPFVQRRARTREQWLLWWTGVVYTVPLILTGNAAHCVFEYLYIGSYFFLMHFLTVIDRLGRRARVTGIALTCAAIFLTMPAILANFYRFPASFNFAYVDVPRGQERPDCGVKAAAYIVRSESTRKYNIQALHPYVEPPVIEYYFLQQGIGYWDIDDERAVKAYKNSAHLSDLLLLSQWQRKAIDAEGLFCPWIGIEDMGAVQMYLYRNCSEKPIYRSVNAREYNMLFDQTFALKAWLNAWD